MKVHQATINFYLRTAKPLSDGSFAIMLRVCYHGYKDISTHYSCPKFYWDSRHQCIKKGFTFAVSYMRSGGSPLALATLMGRSVNTLATYVQELSEENDLVDAVSVMQ